MRLVNCPICGARVSADNEYCPECDFNIREYFNDGKPYDRKKSFVLKTNHVLIIAVSSVLFIFLFSLLIYLRSLLSTENTKDDVLLTKQEEPIDSIISVSENSDQYSKDEISSIPDEEIDVTGVYSGDNNEILVINSDGYAYYYCHDIKYTDLQCPWYIKGNKIFIDFSRTHCTVEATINVKELIFNSESRNWNSELFTKIDVEPEFYLSRKLQTNDPNSKLNYDGTISYHLDGLEYTIPKSFLDWEDELDSRNDRSIFIYLDGEKSYGAAIAFKSTSETAETNKDADKILKNLASRFFTDYSAESCSSTTISGNPAYICKFTAYLNDNFDMLQVFKVNGHLVLMDNPVSQKNTFIIYFQYSDRKVDTNDLFLEVLKSIKQEETAPSH